MSDRIKSMTTQYIAVDDRIRVTGLMEDNRTIVMWLTQRLLGQLIGELVIRLPPEPTERLPVSARRADPVQPVIAEEASVTVLVDTIDLTPGEKEAILIFKAGPDFRSALHLTEREMRQWVQILYRLYTKAGWSLDAWPVRLRSSFVGEVGGQSLTLH